MTLCLLIFTLSLCNNRVGRLMKLFKVLEGALKAIQERDLRDIAIECALPLVYSAFLSSLNSQPALVVSALVIYYRMSKMRQQSFCSV